MIDTLPMPIQPSPNGTSGSKKPRLLTVKFGDGFKQDTGDGLNATERSFTIVWDPIQANDADTIEAFLAAHIGVPFYYTQPREIAPRTWIATGYQRTHPYPTQDALTVQLEERFVY